MKPNISALHKQFSYPLPWDPIPQSTVSAFTVTVSINMFQQPRQWKGSLLFCWGYSRLPLEHCITGSPSQYKATLWYLHTPVPANPGTLIYSGNLPNSLAWCYSTQPLSQRRGESFRGTWATEGLHSWNTYSPGSEGLWHKGQWCFPRNEND